jgi:uncharacterized membrane protein
MPDETNQPTPPASPEPSAFSGAAPAMTPGEVKDGKVFAILCYLINILGFPFWLLPLIMRDNNFSLYHAKQCLAMWVILMVGAAISVPLAFVCIGFVLLAIIYVGFLVLNIIGLLNAINEQAKPLPFIGTYAEKWFAGLKKA